MNKLKLIGLTISVVLLTACGGGSDGGSGESGGGSGGSGGGSGGSGGGSGGSGGGSGGSGGTSGSVNGVNPITPLTQTFSRDFPIAGQNRTYAYKSGYDGNLVTSTSQSFFQIELKEGISELVVKDAHRKMSVDYSCVNGDAFKGTADEDLSTGKVVFSGTVNGTTINCTETYSSPLPFTIFPGDDIDDLLDNWTDDDPMTSTCPDDLDDETEVAFNGVVSCTGSSLTNITVKDSSGKTHKVSQGIYF